MLLCCLSHQCVFMCAVSNENQFMCILKHSGIGSCYFVLFYLNFSKDEAAQAEALYSQNSVYPASFLAVDNPINSKWTESHACSHAHICWRREMGSVQATSSNFKTSWWIFTLELRCFFSLDEEWGPTQCQCRVCCMDTPRLHLFHWPAPL